jgi:hypothetical protein
VQSVQLGDQLEAVALGHVDVGNQYVCRTVLKMAKGDSAARGADDIVAGTEQRALDALTSDGIVIDQ